MNDTDPKCSTCKGSGWNQDIKKRPVAINAPVTSLRKLDALKAYVKMRLLCPDCEGSGKAKV